MEFAILVAVQALIAVFEKQWFWVLYSYASQQINLVNEHLLEKFAWMWMTVCHNTKKLLLILSERQKGKVIKLMAQPLETRLFHTSEKWIWSWLRTYRCRFIRNIFFFQQYFFLQFWQFLHAQLLHSPSGFSLALPKKGRSYSSTVWREYVYVVVPFLPPLFLSQLCVWRWYDLTWDSGVVISSFAPISFWTIFFPHLGSNLIQVVGVIYRMLNILQVFSPPA